MSVDGLGKRTPDPVLDRLFARLPQRLQPRDVEPESRKRRRVESVILLIIALLIAVAAIYDVTRQASINTRLTADIETWREITGHWHFKDISIEQDEKHFTKHDVACANIAFARPGHEIQICFVFVGPIIDGRRATHTGFFLLPYKSDLPKYRYDCFGTPMKRFPCKLTTTPAKAFDTVPADFYEEPEVLASTGRAVSSAGQAAVKRWLEIVHPYREISKGNG